MNDFILQEYIENYLLFDNLINFYKKYPDKQQGTNGDVLNEKNKKCTEIYINPNLIEYNNDLKSYCNELQKILNKYTEKYIYSVENGSFGITTNIKIQYYKPNEGYFIYHSERNPFNIDNLTRHLVFITYLNDVEDDGETEFYYQKIKIKPKKGLTIIFPADWTFTHRGIPSKTQEKYIITGWFNYII